jgi:polysaccharide chain length determinant protein (PEP-CTERM system associated)
MIKNGEISLSEVRRILRRYWWLLPIAVFAGATVGLITAKILPKRYTSQTVVLVDLPTIPSDYVKVDDDLNHRLASMQGQILSRTGLQPVIEKLGIYANDRGHLHTEELVQRLASSVTVKPMESMPGIQNQSLPGFYVSVSFDNPRTAQQVCSEITSMFIEQNARERKQHAMQTTSFLSEQLETAKRKLDEQDVKLAKFKKRYLGALPEEQQTNLNLLMSMNSQLEANVQALARAQQDKAFNESMLGQQEATSAMSRMGQNSETFEQQLSSLQDQLTGLSARYTPEHPDVVKLRNQIEELKKRMADTVKTNPPRASGAQILGPEPAQIQQLRAKLRQDELNIANLSKRQGQIQDQIRELQERLQASPVVEQQLKEIARSYQTALDFYNDLLKKRAQSAMVSDLEHQQESEEFRILDPPTLPDKPSFPKAGNFAAGGGAAGMVVGFGLMYLIALSDKSMHTQRDVELCLSLPVLASVPRLEMPHQENGGALRGTPLRVTS